MKKILLITLAAIAAGGICSTFGLASLAATIWTVTAFGLAHVALFYVCTWGFRVIERLPTWLHDWLAPKPQGGEVH